MLTGNMAFMITVFFSYPNSAVKYPLPLFLATKVLASLRKVKSELYKILRL